jgi:hypothetical protein
MKLSYRIAGGVAVAAVAAIGLSVALLRPGSQARQARRAAEKAVTLAPAAAPAPISAERAGAELVKGGLITAEEELRLVRLGSESGWALFQTPGDPGAGDRVVLVALCDGSRPFANALAHASFDGGQNWSDHPAAPTGTKGEGWLFDLGAHPAKAALQVALKLYGPDGELWLNHAGQDIRTSVGEPAGLEWLGTVELKQDGVPRAVGEPLYASHDLEVAAQTWPPSPDTRVLVRYQIDGGAAREARMRLTSVKAGQYGHNLGWTGRLPTAELPKGSRLTWTIEAQAAGTTRREDDGGKGYAAEISLDPPAPTWAAAKEQWWAPQEAGVRNLPEPFVFDPGQLDVGWGPVPAIELYVPGITDLPKSEDFATGGFVKVEGYSPFFSGRPEGEWRGEPLVFRERSGNNWRFRWNLIRGQEGIPGAAGLAPQGTQQLAEGDYRFKLRVSTDGGRTWVWLGTGDLPQGGSDRTLRVVRARRWVTPALLGNQKIPPTAVGAIGKQHLELLNDSAEPMRLSGFHLWGPEELSIVVDKCAPLAGCAVVLAPGERIGIDLTFAPKEKADLVEATFGAQVEGQPADAFGQVEARLRASAY